MNMKCKLVQIGLVFLTAWMLMGQTRNVEAQTNVTTPATNGIQRFTQEDIEMLRKKATDLLSEALTTTPHGPNLTQEDIEMLGKEAVGAVLANQTNQTHRAEPASLPISKAEKKIRDWMATLNYSHPWPETYHKQATLKHCAAVLRSAFDPNEIELACSKLTNKPASAVALKNLSKAAIASLDELATILINPELEINEKERYGTCATLSNSQNYFLFDFWYTNGLPSVILDADKRLPSGQELIMGAHFYESGKLEDIHFYSHDRKCNIQEEGFSFKEDGKLNRYWIAPKEPTP